MSKENLKNATANLLWSEDQEGPQAEGQQWQAARDTISRMTPEELNAATWAAYDRCEKISYSELTDLEKLLIVQYEQIAAH